MTTVINKYLNVLAKNDGSDLYLSTGAPPCAKFQGTLKPLPREVLKAGEVEAIANGIMDDEQRAIFNNDLEMNLAMSLPGIGRFRVNIFKQRNEVAIVARNINTDIPKFDDLGLPPVLKELVMNKRGLVLFVGGTGSGKSTSLAALIDYRNSNVGGHIITIEDPVEFVHKHKKSIINQREVGVDTRSFKNALKNTLRQAPDVILIGEIRDRETMEHALEFSETGHLAISTLHANNANQALDRVLHFFPEEAKEQVLLDLSFNMKAIVAQQLIPSADQTRRWAAVEVLLATPLVKERVRNGEIEDLKNIMAASNHHGMVTFDQCLFGMYKEGKITYDEAIRHADSANEGRLAVKMSEGGDADSLSENLRDVEIIDH